MGQLLIPFLACFLLGACQLTRVEGEVNDVDIKIKAQDTNSADGKFCPPGQAKKGNC